MRFPLKYIAKNTWLNTPPITEYFVHKFSRFIMSAIRNPLLEYP